MAVTEAQEASAISAEVTLATQGVVLNAVQAIVDGGYLTSLPSTVADAQTKVLAAITELTDPNVNSMATALLSDARDFISTATLNYSTANQSSVSANGSFANANAQLDVASAGVEEFAAKRPRRMKLRSMRQAGGFRCQERH